MVAVSERQAKPKNFVLGAFVSILTLFLILAGYDTFRLVQLNQRASGEAEVVEQSADELAKLKSDERRVLTIREQDALQANPLDRGPVYKLAALAQASGKLKQAEELILLASDRSLRDPRALAHSLPIFVARHDYAGALYRLDGLARTRTELMPKVLPVLSALAEAEESRSALVSVLAQNPPWRARLVSFLIKDTKRPAIGYRLLTDLRNTAAPPTTDEVRTVITGFIKNHDYETAYFVWLDFLNDVELRKVSQIFDGGFETQSRNLFFDWTYIPMKNVDFRFLPRTEMGNMGRALSIEFLNPRNRFANLYQGLRLSPGSYLFSGEVKVEYKPTDASFVWRIYCMDDRERLVTQTPRLRQAQGWMRFEMALEIPSSCHTQRIQLELDARAVLDHQVTGRVSYDNLAISLRNQGATPDLGSAMKVP